MDDGGASKSSALAQTRRTPGEPVLGVRLGPRRGGSGRVGRGRAPAGIQVAGVSGRGNPGGPQPRTETSGPGALGPPLNCSPQPRRRRCGGSSRRGRPAGLEGTGARGRGGRSVPLAPAEPVRHGTPPGTGPTGQSSPPLRQPRLVRAGVAGVLRGSGTHGVKRRWQRQGWSRTLGRGKGVSTTHRSFP